MSKHTSLNQNSKKDIPSDCLICALRPALYLNQINIFQAKFFCRHSNSPSRPHFEPSKFFKSITVICNIILMFAIYNDFKNITGKFTPKHVLLYLEIAFFTSMVIFHFLFLLRNDIKLLESHALIELFNNKFKFGVFTILPSKTAKLLHKLCLCSIIAFISEEIIMFSVVLALEDVDKELLLRMLLVELVIFSSVSFGLTGVQMFLMYHVILDRCYDEIEKFLSRLRVSEEVSQISGSFFINRLQKLQRLYMCLRRNYKVNEEVLQPHILTICGLYVCILLIGYGYFATTFILGEVGMLRFDLYVLVKSLGLALSFYCLCFEAQTIATKSENLLSYLFKYPISKLSPLESAQIEMLISSLNLLKPELNASHIFTLGTALMVSMSTTVITYILAALQFHAVFY